MSLLVCPRKALKFWISKCIHDKICTLCFNGRFWIVQFEMFPTKLKFFSIDDFCFGILSSKTERNSFHHFFLFFLVAKQNSFHLVLERIVPFKNEHTLEFKMSIQIYIALLSPSKAATSLGRLNYIQASSYLTFDRQ